MNTLRIVATWTVIGTVCSVMVGMAVGMLLHEANRTPTPTPPPHPVPDDIAQVLADELERRFLRDVQAAHDRLQLEELAKRWRAEDIARDRAAHPSNRKPDPT